MTTSKLYLQNLYEPTLSSASVAASGDVTFALSITPSYTKGFITFSPSNASQREIMYFDDVIGSTVYVKSENRGLGGTSAKAHTQGEIVAMKDVAEIFNFFSDNISNAFYVEKKGGLNVNVWGGTVYYNGVYQNFSDTALVLTASTTNYIQYDYPTNTISVSLVDNYKTKAVVVTGLTSITSITYQVAKESYIDFVVALNTALPVQTGNARKVLKTDGTNAAWGEKDDYAVDTGAANAYAVTIADATYTTGLAFSFLAANANTTTSTINVNALGVKTIKDMGGQNLGANAILAGSLLYVVYNGTDFICISGLRPTTVNRGQVELATDAEVLTGTDTERYVNSFQVHSVFGQFARLDNVASNTQTIAHGLGRIPRMVTIEGHYVLVANGGVDAHSTGMYNGTTKNCISWANLNGTGATRISTTNVIEIITSSYSAVATIAIDAINITLTWTVTTTGGTSNIVVLWEAI